MIPRNQSSHVSFGVFEVDLEAGEVRKAGLRVRLAGQPFRILAALLAHPGEVVTREKLQQEIWGADTNVDFERGIASAINKLRDALGDSADHPVYIETLARRGYRFIAPVIREADVSTEESNGSSLKVPPNPADAAALDEHASLQSLLEGQGDSQAAPHSGRSQRRNLGISIVVSAAALALIVVGAGVSYHFANSPISVRLPRIQQLTDDNSLYTGPPNPETLLTLETDGPRIYAPVLLNGSVRISSLELNGAQVQPITMPSELQSVSITDISSDGSKLLVRSSHSREPEQPLWIVSTSGAGAQRVGEVMAHDAVWVPDQSGTVLFAFGKMLEEVELDTGAIKPYVSLPGRAFWLRWSPDGKKLRFTMLDTLTHTTSLWELDTSTRRIHPLHFDALKGLSTCCGSWTPSGDLYIFQAANASSSDLWALRTGSRPRLQQLTNGPLSFTSPLPSREARIVYAFGSSQPAATMLYDRSLRRFVAAPHFLSQAQRLTYSRDGSAIAWIDAAGHLWRAGHEGAGLLRLTGDDREVYLARWSPDGQQLLMMARRPGETWQIDMVPADGGAIRKVLSDPRNLADPDWSPDGQKIVFGREADLMGKENGTHDIQILDLKTGQIKTLPGSADLFSPRWSPDGRHIAALSRDQARLVVFDMASKTWMTLFSGGAADPIWAGDSNSIYFHAFAEPDSAIDQITLQGHLETIADLSMAGLQSVDSFYFSGITPDGLPFIKPSVGTGNLYSITLPEVAGDAK